MSPATEVLGLRTFLLAMAGLFRQWRLVVAVPAICGALAVVWVLLLQPIYRADATFIVDSETGSPRGVGLAGLATQLGVQLPSAGQSPTFFADLATTREVLLSVAEARYPVATGSADSLVSLPALFKIRDPGSPRGVEEIVGQLRGAIHASADGETGMVTVTAEFTDPALAAAVVDTLLSAMNRFNLERRQLRSRALRLFLEGRLASAAGELHAAEDSLRGFRERNRAFAQSPELALRDQRLQRSVDLRQQLYVNLSTSYEQARIEEFRDTPSITVVDPPRTPYGKTSPKRRLIVIAAAALGLFVGLAVALLRQSVRTLGDEERSAWAAARSAAADIPVIRALRRRDRTS